MQRCMKLKDKVVVITGAAQGLGQALAQRCSEEGAKVVVADLNLEGAQETAALLKDAIAVKVDVTKYADCEAVAQAAIEKYGRIDVLVSNAAIVMSGGIEEFDPEKWKFVVDVNLCGCFNSIKAVIPQFRKQGGGAVVQINSKSGKKGSAKNSAYAASKFGGIGLVESLALELAAENIRVNAICPGNMLDSPLWVNSLFKQYAKNQGITEEEVRQKYIDQVPMKRGCTYEDVANAMVFLACDDSSYMTGQGINVTGGQQMQP
ncbi:sorbitol-6-phosphate dehydrogenase [Christensenellaceae bacterium OttesenSCG-928-K19]|nr:sorbitol-6-phosphate dehydrogenase [Christensenellaceae bacterium OttesenSCG-928-K19]